MKHFFYTLSFFALPLLALFAFCEFSLRHIHSSYALKRDGLIAQSNRVEILIVGNSHASDGINPACFSRPAYNLAYGSQTLVYDKELIMKYAPILGNLKYVIIGIDYPSLYWGFVKERDFFYYHYYGINVKNKPYIKEKLSFFFYVYSPRTAISILMANAKPKLVDGWEGHDGSDCAALTDELGKQRVELFNADIRTSIQSKEHAQICADLEQLIVFLKKKGVTPILVTAPCYKYLTSHFDRHILDDNLSYISQLTNKYDLVYLNSLEDPSFEASDYFNNDHLNRRGSEKYSKIIDRLIGDTQAFKGGKRTGVSSGPATKD